MERRLHLLDTFTARGSDGATYHVKGYEHLVRDDSTTMLDQWEPTGEVEYRLAEGEPLEVERDGTLRIARTGVALAAL